MTAPRLGPSAIWLLLMIALLTGCATTRSETPPRTLPPPVREVLPNGLRLIIQEHRASPFVALQLWIAVGGRDERPEERGFAHFAEHMLFKGTETLGPGFVDQEVEAYGGRTNAATSNDYTFYYLLLPVARASRGIEVLADVAVNSKFDPEEIAREREVVFEEMRLGEDNPRASLGRRLYGVLFQGHPYGRPVLGDPAALRGATRETLRGFYKRHYIPEKMTVVVVGAVDPDSVRAIARRTFGTFPAAGQARAAAPVPSPPAAPLAEVVARPERQASLGLAWVAPRLASADTPAVDVLAHILGGSRSSRLNQALREKARIVSSISAGYSALEWGGAVMVTAQFEPALQEQVEAGILAQVRRIQDTGVAPDELERAITASEAELVFSRETVEGLAVAYGRAETVWTLENERQYLDRLRTVTREQVQEAARRYLSAPYARLAFQPKARPQ